MPEPTPLLLVEGIFHDPGTGITVYPNEGDPVGLDEALASYQGSEVNLSIHHLPTHPPDLTVAGGGSCLWGGACPAGHLKDPAWLFHWASKGVLERVESGMWKVSEDTIPLRESMIGHRGRLVLFKEQQVSQDQGVESLLEEAEGLVALLTGLQGALKP